MVMIARVHRWVGALGVAVFLGTGLYLRTHFPQLHGGDDAIRYQFRANHVYILLTALANALVGLHLVAQEAIRSWRAQVQRFGSLLLVLSPPLAVIAFAVEPPHASPERPLTLAAIVALLLGTGLHALGRLRRGR
jgi:hypothetical protein